MLFVLSGSLSTFPPSCSDSVATHVVSRQLRLSINTHIVVIVMYNEIHWVATKPLQALSLFLQEFDACYFQQTIKI